MPVRPGIVVRPALLLGALLTAVAGASVVSTATTLSGLGSLGARASVHLSTGAPAPVTGTQGTVPPNNPPQNIPPNPNFLSYCSGSTFDNSQTCTNAVLQAIANARASEGLPGMSLPSTWYSLTPAQQEFVVTDLERAARGLPILPAMATALDGAATQGAANSDDPTPPSGFPWSSWGSNWAGAVGNPLEAMYYWMYDDGMGSNNIDCTPSNTSGCWGHRDNVLMPLRCQPCVMGTGYVGNGYRGYPSWAELLVDTTGNPQIDYTYAQLTGEPQSSPAPGPGSPSGAPSIAIGPSGLPTIAVQGPGGAIWVYWEAANAQWYGPHGVGTGYGAPSIAISPTSGLPTIAVQGPGGEIWVYWEANNAQWYGPYGVGTGYGAPDIASGSTGLPTIAVQGPGGAIWVYWEAANAQWYGPLGVGTGYGAPRLAIGPHSGLPTVAVQGPGNSLWIYWEAANAQWYGPLGVGGSQSTNAPPSIAVGPSGLPTLAVMAPGANWVYWEANNAQWYGPLAS